MKKFDFDNVGKRMPYNVPDGFFDEARKRACAITGDGRQARKPQVLRRAAAIAAAAAVIIGAAVIGLHLRGERPAAADPQQLYLSLLADASDDILEEMGANYMEEISND